MRLDKAKYGPVPSALLGVAARHGLTSPTRPARFHGDDHPYFRAPGRRRLVRRRLAGIAHRTRRRNHHRADADAALSRRPPIRDRRVTGLGDRDVVGRRGGVRARRATPTCASAFCSRSRRRSARWSARRSPGSFRRARSAILFGFVLLFTAYRSIKPREEHVILTTPDKWSARLRLDSTYPTAERQAGVFGSARAGRLSY